MPQTAPSVAAPLVDTPPTMRELRAQVVHRLQIGMSGLAAMLLLVGLANIILDRARDSEPQAGPGAMAPKKSASDPLADIGVAPSASPSASAARAN